MKLPFNLYNWINDNRGLLKPPVGNKVLFEDSEFILMVVGGPNSRNDFHIDESEEIFYQLEGEMVLKIVEDGKMKNISIKAGEMFLLPKRVPHSPQRFAESVGLVIERKRTQHEKDGFCWYCENCNNIVYEVFVSLENIEKDMPNIFSEFYLDQNKSSCKTCGTRVTKPSGPMERVLK